MDKIHLFVYGSLLDGALRYRITGKQFPTSPAYLDGFKKFMSQLGYPYIASSRGSRVDGLLVRNVDADSLKRIDAYEDEGRLYFRKQVVAICGAEEIACEVYVANEKLLFPRS